MKNATHDDKPGRTPNQWEEYFRRARVQVEALDATKSDQGRATILGRFLAQNQGREVPISVGGRPGKARLCVEPGGKRQRLYSFQITWDEAPPPGTPPPAEVDLTDGLDDGPGPPKDGAVTSAVPSSLPPPSVPAPPPTVTSSQPAGPGEDSSLTAKSGNQESWS